jgi:hypothetical protein
LALLRFAPARRSRLAELPGSVMEVQNGITLSHGRVTGMALEERQLIKVAAMLFGYGAAPTLDQLLYFN